MCFGGEKLYHGAGNAAVEQVTPAAHQQPHLHVETSVFKMIFLKSRPEIAEGGRAISHKRTETEITFSNKINPGIQL